MVLLVVSVVGILVIVYIFTTYNEFVTLRNLVKEAFATMDVYLKKRWDLIPNLVETVRGYAKHERNVLESMAALRNPSYESMSVGDKIAANEQLAAGVSKIIAVAENYPDLKASETFQVLLSQLAGIEEDIANARKYYNAVVKNMNTKIEMVPSNMVAMLFHFELYKMFEAGEGERNNVKVELS